LQALLHGQAQVAQHGGHQVFGLEGLAVDAGVQEIGVGQEGLHRLEEAPVHVRGQVAFDAGLADVALGGAFGVGRKIHHRGLEQRFVPLLSVVVLADDRNDGIGCAEVDAAVVSHGTLPGSPQGRGGHGSRCGGTWQAFNACATQEKD
jgi:hypothetical protein